MAIIISSIKSKPLLTRDSCPIVKGSNVLGKSAILLFIFFLLSNYIFFNNKVVYYKILPLRGIFAHIKLQQLFKQVFFFHCNLIEPDILTNEVAKFIGRYLTQPFKTSYFGIRAKLCNRIDTFFFCVTIDSFLLVSNTEERGLKNIDMSLLNQIGEELKKEGK